MDASIELDSTEGIAVRTTDNQGIEHRIEMHPNGEIDYHATDGYQSDPSDRTTVENERFTQTRRYTKYHVAQETAHETLPWDLNPDRFETVRQALAALSSEEIEELFGDLLAQSLSHYHDEPNVDIGDISRPHELPADKIGPEDAVLYKQEIYLDETDQIEAVSGVLLTYYVAKGERTTVRHGDAPERDPDACVEVSPAPLVAPEPFRDFLVYNLRCQIRDCYVGMGLEPPEKYKVLGPGQYRFTGKYQHFDCYPKYYNYDADIPGYHHDFVPELPISKSELGGLVDPEHSQSIYSQIKGALFSR
ncbi:hypothetical protein [Natronolimnobius baerhuensis]|uniref:Uncharacterized protein n=1 Tax=Natronolimnobius baerhuensis TaxID=253108 RepID=A0A202E9P8_9EURY|nr:hypothetical protein [Natronolimnobius baerhuensis]OVE84972.1 hypothetical protein B2G88_11480 [Natronolimnobius baerhuensis]